MAGHPKEIFRPVGYKSGMAITYVCQDCGKEFQSSLNPAIDCPYCSARPARRTAQWPQPYVDALNRYQQSGEGHPYTCGGNRTDENHLDGEGILVATINGWVCPYCDYRQNWALDPLELPPFFSVYPKQRIQ